MSGRKKRETRVPIPAKQTLSQPSDRPTDAGSATLPALPIQQTEEGGRQ